MFKTYNVGDSFWQMNLFMAMQVHRNLSTLSYMSVPSVEDEPEQELEETADRRKIPQHEKQ